MKWFHFVYAPIKVTWKKKFALSDLTPDKKNLRRELILLLVGCLVASILLVIIIFKVFL